MSPNTSLTGQGGCLWQYVFVPYLPHSIHWSRNQRPSCLSSSRSNSFDFLNTWQWWIRHLTSFEHSKCQSEGCPRTGDVQPDVLVIPGYALRKQISNLLLTLASSQVEIHLGSRTLESPYGNCYAPAWGRLVMMMNHISVLTCNVQ